MIFLQMNVLIAIPISIQADNGYRMSINVVVSIKHKIYRLKKLF